MIKPKLRLLRPKFEDGIRKGFLGSLRCLKTFGDVLGMHYDALVIGVLHGLSERRAVLLGLFQSFTVTTMKGKMTLSQY